jgi:3-phenylpropionate/cinnamic acid dioxygenase small subunit
MTGAEALAAAADVLHREALYLDQRRWDEWLALYREDAEFWVPAWKSESEPTADPDNEVSLIYISSRVSLEERVSRVKSGRSAASTPLPRTAHALSNILVDPGASAEALTARAVAATHIFDLRRREPHLIFGHSEYRLARNGAAWLIRRKKVVVLNDYLTTIIDFYTV